MSHNLLILVGGAMALMLTFPLLKHMKLWA